MAKAKTQTEGGANLIRLACREQVGKTVRSLRKQGRIVHVRRVVDATIGRGFVWEVISLPRKG